VCRRGRKSVAREAQASESTWAYQKLREAICWCVVDLRCCFVALSLSRASDLDLSCEESAVLDGVTREPPDISFTGEDHSCIPSSCMSSMPRIREAVPTPLHITVLHITTMVLVRHAAARSQGAAGRSQLIHKFLVPCRCMFYCLPPRSPSRSRASNLDLDLDRGRVTSFGGELVESRYL